MQTKNKLAYFKGMKGKGVVAISYGPIAYVPTCKILQYIKISKQEYAKLDKLYFNA